MMNKLKIHRLPERFAKLSQWEEFNNLMGSKQASTDQEQE